MTTLFSKIGWAADEYIPRHAHLLTLDRDDPHGSAAVEDEEMEQDHNIVDEDDRLDDDDLDDQPRGKRADKSDKEAKAYDKLKSERDKLQQENQKQARTLEELNTRLSRLETTRETREDANQRNETERAIAAERARKLRDELAKLNKEDPQYSEKYFEVMEAHNERIRAEERRQILEEVERSSTNAVRRVQNDEDQYEKSKKITLNELREQGLSEECFDLVEALAIAKARTDPDWFKRTPDDEQIPAFVSAVKERLMKSKRSSQEYQDEKRRHREDMDGVIGEGSSVRRGRESRGEDRGNEGPGSILSDLSRNREQQRKFTTAMLRRVDR